ncbi:hypothetical protein PUN28_008231 [Cardiocondyla obscurior]|uniref:Histone H3 n=1 Tax=Cardiocondyla obscurior TaxID=286306 RepID=A0AAW2FX86_9HYME
MPTEAKTETLVDLPAGAPRRKRTQRGRGRSKPAAEGSPDSTTSPEKPRILKVEVFPPEQPLSPRDTTDHGAAATAEAATDRTPTLGALCFVAISTSPYSASQGRIAAW